MNGEGSGVDVFGIIGAIMYVALALIAAWGAYCVVIVWVRVSKKRFRNELAQTEFLEAVERPLSQRDFDGAAAICEGDSRAVPQLIYLAIANRKIGYGKVRHMVMDRFQRDVLADLEHRMSWISTVIKSAPMVGLLGTVLGMMGTFSQLYSAENVQAQEMAGNIMIALITTACGLAIAIPLVLAMASINVRIRKMEDLVGSGMTRFLETYRYALTGTRGES